MDQWVAMGSMVLDHISATAGDWMDVCGNMALPIYVYRRVGARDWARVGAVAVAAEIPHWLLFGYGGNVCWLFLCAVWLQDQELQTLGIAGMTAMILLNGNYLPWVALLLTRDRAVWWGVHLGCAILTGWAWLAHLVGYEVARGCSGLSTLHISPGYVGRPPRRLWVSFYPVHMGILGIIKSLC